MRNARWICIAVTMIAGTLPTSAVYMASAAEPQLNMLCSAAAGMVRPAGAEI